jgi:LPS-assembly protein
MEGVTQDSNEEWRYLKGAAKVQTSEMVISADQIDYNSDTHWAYARGHVHLEHFATGDKLNADHAEYNLETEEGRFYTVDGTAPAKIISSPWILSTTNPFYFEAEWAERIKNRYILHHGFVTDCKMPKPWWTFQAPLFDIIPGDRAIARHTIFRVKRVPIVYLPYFIRPLGRNPRQSGFLTPNFGHSTIRGFMYGGGYYWAINRSYDVTGLVQYFTIRGPAETFDFRGKPNENTDFNFNFYAVQDKGYQEPNGTLQDQGGQEFELTARTKIWGFTGRLDYNYLSSYLFRQAFASSFTSAISSQVSSIGYLQRHFKDDTYTVNIVASRDTLFESVTLLDQPANAVIIQKAPSLEVFGRDQELVSGPVPVWFSFSTTAGLLGRQEPTFQTGWDVARTDIQPRVSTAFDFKGFTLTPSLTFGATDYGKSYAANSGADVQVANANLFRKDADFVLDFRPPPIEKVFVPAKWLHLGEKVKHVVEVDATYEYLTGINEFQRIIHFDSTDVLSNTNQLTVSLTNRLYRKDKNGVVSEFVTWRLSQARYFDPTFGGAVLPGQRNVVLASEELTPFAFLDGPRDYSPIVSSLILTPYSFLSVEWRANYDPLVKKIVGNTYAASVRHGQYGVGVSDTSITTNPLLAPQANQFTFGASYGSSNRRGWNAALLMDYNLLTNQRLYEFVQTSYNTNCCGFSFQLRRFNLGIRNENQYLFSFSVANVGAFGSMQRQERIF